ncbi:hypothetical protein C4568_01420 [Candidatus Parcubacteria bacterium]|nr:MAG: hypothetical protein C4568_01420 [Candidatus Parcubacteria bacterium]
MNSMRKKNFSSIDLRWITGGLVIVFILAVITTQTSAPLTLQIAHERLMMKIDPSGDRAYKYGTQHMDGEDPRHYDIQAAETFLKQAVKLDPNLLYVHHQLARVAFLKGDFSTALFHINLQIQKHGKDTPNSYYVRGLIEGYMGDYASAAEDYEKFLKVAPYNWAAINDYAWVLLKDERFEEAARATEEGLKHFPENPWLLNSSAIALYEIGDIEKAHERVQKAWAQVQNISKEEWLHSYPGNDPAVAGEGIATFHDAVAQNVQKIDAALALESKPQQ